MYEWIYVCISITIDTWCIHRQSHTQIYIHMSMIYDTCIFCILLHDVNTIQRDLCFVFFCFHSIVRFSMPWAPRRPKARNPGVVSQTKSLRIVVSHYSNNMSLYTYYVHNTSNVQHMWLQYIYCQEWNIFPCSIDSDHFTN